MRAQPGLVSVLALLLTTPLAALLLTRLIATIYASLTMPLVVGREGLYYPDSVQNGLAFAPVWATWSFISCSLPASIVAAAIWLWAWRRQSSRAIAGQRWLTVQSVLLVAMFGLMALCLVSQLIDIPRTDVFSSIRV